MIGIGTAVAQAGQAFNLEAFDRAASGGHSCGCPFGSPRVS
jgi:hypothetical protein